MAIRAVVGLMVLGFGITGFGWWRRRGADVDIRDLRKPIVIYTTFGVLLIALVSATSAVIATMSIDELCSATNRQLMMILGGVCLLGSLGAFGMFLLVRPLIRGILVQADTLEQRIGEATAALRESEERFRSLVEATSDWIWAVDQEAVYTYSSPKVKELLGYDPEEVVGKTPFDLMPPDEAERAAGVFRNMVELKQPFVRLENTNLHKDGRRVVLESSGVPIFDRDGNLRGFRGVDRDITGPKEDEAKLIQALAGLEQSNRDLEHFAYSASHDLQEPLRMMGSYLQALEQGYGDRLDEHARNFIDLSMDAAKRMQQLIDDLLAYAHVGTRGKQFETVNLGAMVDQVVADLQATIEREHAEVTREELPTIRADPTLMTNLLQNLISNAIKFHGQQPPKVHISAEQAGPDWVLAVRDSGIGIDPKHLERVFVIFQRLHTQDQYPGTGIGLAICKRVVERHGGRIWCESEPGKGSTFFFSISRAEGNRP